MATPGASSCPPEGPSGARGDGQGGSGDLGAAICATLARAGCDVAVGDVENREGTDRVARTVEGLGRRARVVQVDQADAGAIEPAVNAAAAGLGRLLGKHDFPHLS